MSLCGIVEFPHRTGTKHHLFIVVPAETVAVGICHFWSKPYVGRTEIPFKAPLDDSQHFGKFEMGRAW